jgi:hypothetical protein
MEDADGWSLTIDTGYVDPLGDAGVIDGAVWLEEELVPEGRMRPQPIDLALALATDKGWELDRTPR